ncbi:hypothetical protein [Streptomyces endophyticus]|uniref:Uncharacterized protein n=1 Tax=Streptomyces endophyticus TaxID=714166 RepID=A0ABU6EZ53_9ACTN|nr:hypothetical protein [Streptomyces endophyticus]MEB8336982.1 hypothetical protein [Streptomyces endophyticus]
MSAEPALYTIRVDGLLGATVLSAFPSLAAQHQVAQTVIVGYLDRSGLYGVLSQLEMLGLDVVELSRACPPSPSPDSGS